MIKINADEINIRQYNKYVDPICENCQDFLDSNEVCRNNK